jgi:hypothetical protein
MLKKSRVIKVRIEKLIRLLDEISEVVLQFQFLTASIHRTALNRIKYFTNFNYF